MSRLDLFVLEVLQMIQEKSITFEIFGLWPATLRCSSLSVQNCEMDHLEVHTELQSQFSNHYLKFARFLELSKSRNQSDFEQHLLQQQFKLKEGNVKPHIISVIFSSWNSLQVKNLNYRT